MQVTPLQHLLASAALRLRLLASWCALSAVDSPGASEPPAADVQRAAVSKADALTREPYPEA